MNLLGPSKNQRSVRISDDDPVCLFYTTQFDLIFITYPRTSSTAVLPLGSDFPVEGINPLLGFYAAVSRLSSSGDSPHGSQGWCGLFRVAIGWFIDS